MEKEGILLKRRTSYVLLSPSWVGFDGEILRDQRVMAAATILVAPTHPRLLSTHYCLVVVVGVCPEYHSGRGL